MLSYIYEDILVSVSLVERRVMCGGCEGQRRVILKNKKSYRCPACSGAGEVRHHAIEKIVMSKVDPQLPMMVGEWTLDTLRKTVKESEPYKGLLKCEKEVMSYILDNCDEDGFYRGNQVATIRKTTAGKTPIQRGPLKGADPSLKIYAEGKEGKEILFSALQQRASAKFRVLVNAGLLRKIGRAHYRVKAADSFVQKDLKKDFCLSIFEREIRQLAQRFKAAEEVLARKTFV